MADRLTTALAALDRLPVPVRWEDVQRRASDPSGGGAGVTELADPPARRGPGPRPRAALLLAAAVMVLAGVAAVLVWPDDEGGPVRTGPGPTSGTTTEAPPTAEVPAPTPTTQPAVGTTWGSAVQVWTGTEYLVWGGQVGDDGRGRADGWRHDPASGVDRPIPVAPIAPRDSAAGVWTGTELVVCCGRDMGDGPAYDTASAAAYDPATDAWRRLADPPAATNGYVVGSAWTGSEVLVVSQVGDPSAELAGHDIALFAYDPTEDRWAERAAPPFGDRFGEVVWTGDRLVLWARQGSGADLGLAYDPAADRWDALPDVPAGAAVHHGSAAVVDGELLVFGLDAGDETRTVGYRLRLGAGDAWRPMAPAPLRPIEWYQGTPGSQTLVADEARGRLIVYPTNGYESGAGGVEGPAPPPLLAYDPATDSWAELGDLGSAGYAPDLLVGGDHLLTPERTEPVVLRLDP